MFKIPCTSWKVLEKQFKSLGAGSATISSVKLSSLQQGTVDGTENPYNNFDTMKFYEVQKYLFYSQHGRLRLCNFRKQIVLGINA